MRLKVKQSTSALQNRRTERKLIDRTLSVMTLALRWQEKGEGCVRLFFYREVTKVNRCPLHTRSVFDLPMPSDINRVKLIFYANRAFG